MSITDKLRLFAADPYTGLVPTDQQQAKLRAIADRIDAEHQKAMSRAGQLLADAESDRDYNYANWQECKQKVLQGNITFDELNAKIERLEDELAHCIELPKDADGEYIHVGDEVETTNFGTVEVEGFVHCAVAFYDYSEQPTHLCTTPANLCRHHHALTVEDVLREFADEMNQNLGMYTGEAIDADEWRDADAKTIAEYAKRLTLAGDAE